MLEILKTGNPDELKEYGLYINGVLSDSIEIHTYGKKAKEGIYWGIRIYDRETYKLLASHCFSELPEPIEYLDLSFEQGWSSLFNRIWISPIKADIGKYNYDMSFNYEPDLTKWKGEYSCAEYVKEFACVFEASNFPDAELGLYTREQENYSFSVKFVIGSPLLQIAREVDRCSEIVRAIHEQAITALALTVRQPSVVATFDFPEEIRASCEQYLVYFVQFLRDLGVEATSELQDKAGQTLFTVTPKHPQEALSKIRIALDEYLRFPFSPIENPSEGLYEIVIQRLVANIQHLKGQLMLSQAILQAKDATILAQQTTIEQRRYLPISETIFEPAGEAGPIQKKADVEELFDGTLAIKPYEGKGFEINLPKIFRLLRNLFADKKSDITP